MAFGNLESLKIAISREESFRIDASKPTFILDLQHAAEEVQSLTRVKALANFGSVDADDASWLGADHVADFL